MRDLEQRLLGSRVEDSEAEDSDTGVIVAVPDKTADEWDVHGEGHTVATYPGNEEYPDDARIVVVVWQDSFADAGLDDYEGNEPLDLSKLAEAGVPHYTFPAPRLEVLATERSL